VVVACLVLCFGIWLGGLRKFTKTSGPEPVFRPMVDELISSSDRPIATYRKRYLSKNMKMETIDC
jgi:hypothetical protein